MTILPKGLSWRLLVVTAVFIMLAEILIFVPSVANYRLTWLARHFNTGEAAALALEQLNPDEAEGSMAESLLDLARTDLIVMRADGTARVLARSAMPGQVDETIRLRMPGRNEALASISEAFTTLLSDGQRTIRLVGPMQSRAGELELVMREAPLRNAMLSYAINVLLISFFISLGAAVLVFGVLRWLLIRPLQRITGSMLDFAEAPEDPAHVINPSGRDDEIGVVEEQLATMQTRLRGTMTQQRHLAELGLAVSKINHDLRNVLASASLMSERLEMVSDPIVQRLAPRLVRTIDRAAGYAGSVLTYGKVGEDLPAKRPLKLRVLVEEVTQTVGLAEDDAQVELVNKVPKNMEVMADPEHLFRVLTNLVRNAVQAMEGMSEEAAICRLTICAQDSGAGVCISVEDTGPGIPEDQIEHLFTPFSASRKTGGTGLGLSIAAELARAHGGEIRFVPDHKPGTRFDVELPN